MAELLFSAAQADSGFIQQQFNFKIKVREELNKDLEQDIYGWGL